MSDYTFFSKDSGHCGKSYQSLWGCHDICPLLQWFNIALVTQSELTSLTHLNAWGDAKKFCSNVTFLLVLPKEGVVGERMYGLAMVWVHPYQARVSTIDGAAKQLTQLASTGAQLALCPGVVQLRCSPCTPSYRGSPECHGGGEHQQCPLWIDLPNKGLPTPELRLPGCLPWRTQWVSSSSDNNSTWVPVQWHDHAWRQINFLTSRPLSICHKGARD